MRTRNHGSPPGSVSRLSGPPGNRTFRLLSCKQHWTPTRFASFRRERNGLLSLGRSWPGWLSERASTALRCRSMTRFVRRGPSRSSSRRARPRRWRCNWRLPHSPRLPPPLSPARLNRNDRPHRRNERPNGGADCPGEALALLLPCQAQTRSAPAPLTRPGAGHGRWDLPCQLPRLSGARE